MKTQVIEVTPKIAEEWLKKNKTNRNLSKSLVFTYANDMKNGKWSMTHQGIAFYDDGTLCDGQHRLYAVIESGCTITFLVTFGIERQNGSDVDLHRPRNATDAIKIGQLSDWITKEAISIINFIYFPGKRASVHEIVEKCEKHQNSIQFAISCFPSRVKHLSSAHLFAAVLKAYENNVNHEILFNFCKVLITGIPNEIDDVAALRLREHLCQHGAKSHGTYQARYETHLKAQRAIKAFIKREKISKLVTPNEEIYPIDL